MCTAVAHVQTAVLLSELLRHFSSVVLHPHLLLLLAGLLSGAGEDVLVLGRQDYAVRSVRIDSKAETWNATFSRLYMMGRDSASLRDFFMHGAAPKLDQGRPHAGEAAPSSSASAAMLFVCACVSSV
jgi:hypothetical protein